MTDKSPIIALVGNPNVGKSALFNVLTGARQKIGNYPGVTVERKAGKIMLGNTQAQLLDLPGAYSLDSTSLDEQVTRDVILGRQEGQERPDILAFVADASNLESSLRFALELKVLNLPMVLILNMSDLAKRDGLELSAQYLSDQLGLDVVETVAVRRRGLDSFTKACASIAERITQSDKNIAIDDNQWRAVLSDDAYLSYRSQSKTLAKGAIVSETLTREWTRNIDVILLHPMGGILILLAIMFLMFQAVYAWSGPPMDLIEGGFEGVGGIVDGAMADGFIKSFLVNGIIAGVGSVLVFLPQILILFFFILVLESTGYMTRAAFVMDRLMSSVGLSGHSFIPLLSSFACAIPGIMATRSISDQKDRLTTILIAPLMTCSARLPVYTMIIGAFIPVQTVGGGVGLQGLVLFGLYIVGILGAMLAALLLRRSVTKGVSSGFLMEMPRYQWPRLRDILIGLWQRAWVFLRRAGTIIFAATVVLWLLLTYPKVPIDDPAYEGVSQVDYSIAGRIAGTIEPVVAPIGFNRDIALALIPAMAAREVAVAALATAYAIDGDDEDKVSANLGQKLSGQWSLATALAFLAWFVFAPQCISTIAVTRRETNGWKWPIFMLSYLFALAYVAAAVTYWSAVALGLG